MSDITATYSNTAFNRHPNGGGMVCPKSQIHAETYIDERSVVIDSTVGAGVHLTGSIVIKSKTTCAAGQRVSITGSTLHIVQLNARSLTVKDSQLDDVTYDGTSVILNENYGESVASITGSRILETTMRGIVVLDDTELVRIPEAVAVTVVGHQIHGRTADAKLHHVNITSDGLYRLGLMRDVTFARRGWSLNSNLAVPGTNQ